MSSKSNRGGRTAAPTETATETGVDTDRQRAAAEGVTDTATEGATEGVTGTVTEGATTEGSTTEGSTTEGNSEGATDGEHEHRVLALLNETALAHSGVITNAGFAADWQPTHETVGIDANLFEALLAFGAMVAVTNLRPAVETILGVAAANVKMSAKKRDALIAARDGDYDTWIGFGPRVKETLIAARFVTVDDTAQTVTLTETGEAQLAEVSVPGAIRPTTVLSKNQISTMRMVADHDIAAFSTAGGRAVNSLFKAGWVVFQGPYPVFTPSGAELAKQYGIMPSSKARVIPEDIAALPPTVVPDAVMKMVLSAGQRNALEAAASGNYSKWELIRPETQSHLVKGTICGNHPLVRITAKVPSLTPLGLVALVLGEVDPTTIAKSHPPLPAGMVVGSATA